MLLTITNSKAPATDLGYLLHKNPARVHSVELAFGRAHVFYPHAEPGSCTVALLLEIDPVGLVRNRRGPPGESGALEQYVNDRPYVASSFMSVAIARIFATALAGKSKERPELVEAPLPLTTRIATLPCRGGEDFLRKVFEPLGYSVSAEHLPLDEQFPEWGESRYFNVLLHSEVRLRDLLNHLYVLLPVLDDDKHYWVGEDEVEKLLRRGQGWLANHPEREAITRRYLKHQFRLTRDALARLAEENEPDPDLALRSNTEAEEAIEEKISLNQVRLGAVLAVLRQCGARRVLDLGCGEGRLLRALLEDRNFDEIVGLDISYRCLEIAQDRLHLERLAPKQRERIRLLHGSLIYRDRRLEGFDAAAVVEVIEHLDPPRLAAFERVLFGKAMPRTVVLTTPNHEFNVKFESLPAGKFRHRDHRFEWSRGEFQAWAAETANKYGYGVKFLPVGPEDPALGSPSQMAVFSRMP